VGAGEVAGSAAESFWKALWALFGESAVETRQISFIRQRRAGTRRVASRLLATSNNSHDFRALFNEAILMTYIGRSARNINDF
jgi:hypothetical protein